MDSIDRTQDPADSRLATSVVVTTYNRRSNLHATLKPLLDDPQTGEIVVVVDGSRDGSLELLRTWSISEPKLRILFQENAGEGAARQVGIEAARSEIVVLIDDDVVADPLLVSGHRRHHSSHSHNIVLGYMPTQIQIPRKPGQVATFLYARDYEHASEDFEKDPESILNRLWAGNMSIKREDVLRIGLRPSGTVEYHEDMQFGFRCKQEGLSPVFDRSLRARHLHSRGLDEFVSECRRSGTSRAVLREQYPNFADGIDPIVALPFGTSYLIRILASSKGYSFSSTATKCAARLAGQMRLWSVETGAARLLRQIELCMSFNEMRRTLEMASTDSELVAPDSGLPCHNHVHGSQADTQLE